VFKDEYYALDHKEHAITDTRTKKPFYYNDTYWPSPYQRDVWMFNVALAKEAVLENGLSIKVPLFINEGETVIVSTKDGKYDSRA